MEVFQREREINQVKLDEIKMFSSMQSSSIQDSERQPSLAQRSQMEDLESLITVAEGEG